MKNRRGAVLTLAIFAFLFVASNGLASDVPPWFVEEVKDNVAILDPGTTTYCDKDFTVENMSKESAQVHVILGNGSNYSFDLLEPNASKSYNLSPNYPLSGGWEETRGVRIDEARIINSTAGDSQIKIHCK